MPTDISQARKPKIFIGSSTPGLGIALEVEKQLSSHFGEENVSLWKDDKIFPLSETVFDSLLKVPGAFDFGVFVLSPDDSLRKDGAEFLAARDNVLFELGLFFGGLGQPRSFFITPKDPGFHLPSDLEGVVSAMYDPKLERLSRASALAEPCAQIMAAIETSFLPSKPIEAAVAACYIQDRLHMLRHAQSRAEVLTDVEKFITRSIYPFRRVRVGFAAKKTGKDGRIFLHVEDLVPEEVVHRSFSYPHTLAAWALIEGRIFAHPADVDRPCDFERLRRLGKEERVKAALLSLDPATERATRSFLDADLIKERTKNETLRLGDLYQDWISHQPEPYYKQFVSVPVPVVNRLVSWDAPPEYGVLNIDAPDDVPLATPATLPLLELAADFITLGFEMVDARTREGAKDDEL